MTRLVPVVLLAASALAPFQCQSEREPELAIEETPGDALWALAEEQRAKGDTAGRLETLAFLVRRYPNTRYAAMARADLAAAGVALPPER